MKRIVFYVFASLSLASQIAADLTFRQAEVDGIAEDGLAGQDAPADAADPKHSGPTCLDENTLNVLPFCIPATYEKHIRPNPKETTAVHVGIKVEEIEKISDKNLTMTYQLHFTLKWIENRLVITENKTVWDPEDPNQETMILDQNIVDKYLWVPDIAVYNLKDFEMSQVINRMATVRVQANRTVSYIFGARVTVGCNFDFDDFPLDTQTCELYIGSYGHTVEEMIFIGEFLEDRGQMQRPLQYATELTDLDEQEKVYVSKTADGQDGDKYSVCGLKVVLQRGSVGFILRTYFPAGLVVFVSWVSYLIEQKEVVGRLALLVTLTLIEINILNGIAASKIPAKSTTAIEIYVIACLFFVVMGLFEYALILYKKSPVERKRKECMGQKSSDSEDSDTDESDNSGSDDAEDALAKPGRNRSTSKRMSKDSDSLHTVSSSELSSLLNTTHSKDQEEKEKEGEGKSKKKAKKTAERMLELSKVTKVSEAFDTKNIDIVSGLLFPTLFVIFNIAYWSYYKLK